MKFSTANSPTLDSKKPTATARWSAKALSKRGRLAQAAAPSSRSSESGVTLLECLIGVAVIAITATLILPPLFIASASRVQNRRAEQAFQIAQDEIDRIQTLVASGQHTATNLPASAGAFTNGATVGPPTGVAGVRKCVDTGLANQYTGSGVGALQAIPIDIDGITVNGDPCAPEFYMQVFRSVSPNDTAPGGNRQNSFILGVRVYSVIARPNFGSMATPVQPAALNITSGTGSQRVRPLVALYPRMTWSDQGTTLCQLHQQGGTPCP
ncbi:type II secretion system protein [Leptolyngbya sp. O-77]|uniref:type II secretion system protein n=1 Tax=Leptolyngbya sp. O-77 TaxID=1080068 RepID=UPI00074D44C5|nr:type II secretion system protein [Leptolyngbya sp. O-77]BAU41922.1 hypothetical protein O77CONTIG1_01740 [Leptolyngbya sp. O-77]